MRMAVVILTGLLVPLVAEAFSVGSAGISVGGSWMTQDYDYRYTTDFPMDSPVDAGVFGPAGGGFLYLQLLGSFCVGFEVLYNQKGFEDTYITTNAQGHILGERTDRYRAHYLSVPVTARYEFGSVDRQLHIFAGFSSEILLKHDDTFDFLTPITLGGLVGIGFGLSRFGVNLRYFSDLTDSSDSELPSELLSMKNYGIVTPVTFALWR